MKNQRLLSLRKKAPQIIIGAIAIVIAAYLLIEILEDIVIEGVPITSGPLIGAIMSFVGNVTATIESWGYTGVFILMVLESSSVPIPSEVILPFAGFLASLGQLDFWITVLIATVAGVLGSIIDYYIGLKGVDSLTKHRILGRILFSPSQLSTASRWFEKYGSSMVLLSRLVPGFRTVVSFPAGAVRMSITKFVTYTIAGCFVWNVILVYLGWFLGSHWEQVAGISRYLILATIVAIAIIIIVYVIRIRQKQSRLPVA